ncbi:MAG TPA: hypothetical protein VHA80_05950 [Solirubrobacterales bacterium]|nr:hypothetical protein [Solirubrobacterales bacterium]
MNWLRKGPDLKLSEMKVPDVVYDLYYDLKERHLLPLVALLLIAMVAAPIYVKGSTKPDPEPLPHVGPTATASDANAGGGIVVARSTPGLRDFKRRLKGAHALDPFERRGEAAPAAEGSTAAGELPPATGAAASPVEIPAEATVVGAEPGHSPPAETAPTTQVPPPTETTGGPEPQPGATGGKVRTRYESSAIDVRIVSVAAASADGGAKAKERKPRAQVRHDLPELTMLPARSTPAATFMGTSRDGKKALMLVSSDVLSTFGEANCVIGSRSCQLLALEPGMPETFVYGPHERTFRIEVLKIDRTLSAKPRRAALGSTRRKPEGDGDGPGESSAAGGTTGAEPAGRGQPQ